MFAQVGLLAGGIEIGRRQHGQEIGRFRVVGRRGGGSSGPGAAASRQKGGRQQQITEFLSYHGFLTLKRRYANFTDSQNKKRGLSCQAEGLCRGVEGIRLYNTSRSSQPAKDKICCSPSPAVAADCRRFAPVLSGTEDFAVSGWCAPCTVGILDSASLHSG